MIHRPWKDCAKFKRTMRRQEFCRKKSDSARKLQKSEKWLEKKDSA